MRTFFIVGGGISVSSFAQWRLRRAVPFPLPGRAILLVPEKPLEVGALTLREALRGERGGFQALLFNSFSKEEAAG